MITQLDAGRPRASGTLLATSGFKGEGAARVVMLCLCPSRDPVAPHTAGAATGGCSWSLADRRWPQSVAACPGALELSEGEGDIGLSLRVLPFLPSLAARQRKFRGLFDEGWQLSRALSRTVLLIM